MRHFFEVIKDDGRPWLIVGKGPSVERFKPADAVENYRVITINHAVNIFPLAECAHVIDTEVLSDVDVKLSLASVRYLVMPWFPHIEQRPCPGLNLNDLCTRIDILGWMKAKDRLLWYNLDTGPRYEVPGLKDQTISAKYFSSEACVNLLGEAGVRTIKTIGLDGGKQRAKQFEGLPFENPHGTYDFQFAQIDKLVQKYRINLSPLQEEPCKSKK